MAWTKSKIYFLNLIYINSVWENGRHPMSIEFIVAVLYDETDLKDSSLQSNT